MLVNALRHDSGGMLLSRQFTSHFEIMTAAESNEDLDCDLFIDGNYISPSQSDVNNMSTSKNDMLNESKEKLIGGEVHK